MIYTVTLNPALDYVMHLPCLKEGGINRTTQEELQFGGKGINVSRVLREFGVESTALGFVAGFTGHALERGLAEQGMHTDFVHLEQGNTRINVKLKSGCETEINAQGPVVESSALEQLFQKLDALKQNDILVLAGSVPASVPSDIYEHMLARVCKQGVLTVVDAEKELLNRALGHRPFLVKPNHIELGELFGTRLESVQDVYACAQKLQCQGARNVLVSMAENGAMLLDENGEYCFMNAPKGSVQNSVGAGDAMVAGFLAGMLETGNYTRALEYGVAAGSATAFSAGLATREQINAVMDMIHTQKEKERFLHVAAMPGVGG